MTLEISFEEKLSRLRRCIEQVRHYEVWREMAVEVLQNHLAARIYALRRKPYLGSGFHYGLEQELGTLICRLATPPAQAWNMNMNDYDRLDEIWGHIMAYPVKFEFLCRQVVEAEQSLEK